MQALKIICIFFLLMGIIASAYVLAEDKPYQASQSGNILQLATPHGQRLYLGDVGFSELRNYKIEIDLNELRSQGSSSNAANGGGGSAQNPAGPGGSPAPQFIEDESTLIVEANRLYNEGKFTDSLKYVDEIIRRNPKNMRGWVMKGSLMHVMGQKDLARDAWQKAHEIDPKNEEIGRILKGNP